MTCSLRKMGNCTYPHVINVPRIHGDLLKLVRASMQFEGRVVIEDTGTDSLRVECELLEDRALLVFLT